MIKFKLYFDKDAETEWLNDMSARGWAMTHFFAGFYTFEQCACGKYNYQIDFADKPFAVSNEYREFMHDAGIEIVQTWGYWVILRKPASEGTFELYTDVESSIAHYSKIRMLFKAVTILELICLWVEVMAGVISKNPYSILFVLLLSAIVIVLVRMVIHTTNIIDNLKERQTGIPIEKKRNVSGLLTIGLLVNAGALLIQDSVSVYIKDSVQIIAIVLMFAGIWKTCRKK